MTDADEIRNALARLCQCVDDRRFDEFSQTFAEDGSFNDRVGRATILKWIQGAEVGSEPWSIRVGHDTDELVRQPTGEWLFAKRHLAFLPA